MVQAAAIYLASTALLRSLALRKCVLFYHNLLAVDDIHALPVLPILNSAAIKVVSNSISANLEAIGYLCGILPVVPSLPSYSNLSSMSQ